MNFDLCPAMNTSLLLLSQVLTCLVLVNFIPVYGQSTCCPTDSCCDDGCPSLTPYNVTLDELVSMQPLYVNFFPAIALYAGVDNVCFTYSPLPDETYLLFISTVYCNGFNVTESFIKSQSDVGVFLLGSSTCSSQFTVFDYLETDDCSLYLGYLCFTSRECSLAPGNDIPVFGFSSNNTRISQDCLDRATDRISRAGLPSQDYFIAPFEQNSACVTDFNCTVTA